jgi:photosystem II stability/assembly factor-like uncharacterized protein
MKQIFRSCRRAAWPAFIHIALTVLLAPAARAERDVLERPALQSARAASSVMLGIATAGQRLVAVGERGIIIYSDNGGQSWQQASVPVSVSLTGVRFADAANGWAVGHSGVVLHTRDGGKTWSRQLDGLGAARAVLEAVRAGRVGAGADAGKALANAERMVQEGPSKPFFDAYFFDARNGMIVGAFGLLLTTQDGGASWQSAHDRIDNPRDKHLYAIEVAGKRCYIAGEQGALFRSEDCRTRFESVATPYAGTYFGAIVSGPETLLVYGMRGNAFRSEDGGANWSKSTIPTTNSLTAGTRLRDGTLLVADETGQLYRSVDAGRSFARVPNGQATPFTGVVQSSSGQLYFSGVRGVTRIALNTP